MTSTRDIGNKGEDMAVAFLQQKGYNILERNFRYKRNEIDIVARVDNLLIFVEVKLRRDSSFGYPETFVSDQQIDRIMDAAEEYQLGIDWKGPVRYDIISIEGEGDDLRITHFKDALQ